MKYLVCLVLLSSFVFAQEEKMVSIPESKLTEQQRAELQKENATAMLGTAHGWVGIGKEVGEAVNSSLSAVTVQADNFSKTGVGKLTVALVVWKVIGDQAVHLLGGMIELLVFVPIFLWSYRKSCMSRRVLVASEGLFKKKTWQYIEYEKNREFTARNGHCLILAVFTIVWVLTVFTY